MLLVIWCLIKRRKKMNKNHKLSEKTFGPRHVQPHQPDAYATKPKKITKNLTVQEMARRDSLRK